MFASCWLSSTSCQRTVELDPDSGGAIDARPPDAAACVPGPTQCTDCVDNDGDGEIDGFDPECTGAADNDEASFSTGINGDNTGVAKQDCAFDGNSGSGDDGCDIHVCCDLTVCPPNLPGPTYDPSMCVVPQACKDFCLPLTPPGCDCFGCCTICSSGTCQDIYIQPAVSPSCTEATLDDPTACPRCTKTAACDNPCGGCTLCPGQGPSDLPPSCNGTATCPTGEMTCTQSSECGTGQFCASGCCISAPA